jgi:hypothetical protein
MVGIVAESAENRNILLRIPFLVLDTQHHLFDTGTEVNYDVRATRG